MKRQIALFITGIWLVSCASVQVSSDFDSQVDFTKFKTYALTQESLQIPVEQLNRDRIIRAIETELAAKGFTKAESPDVLIDVHVKAEEKMEATATNTGGYGYGYGRYGYGGGFSTTRIDYNKYTEGSLFINMVDRSVEKVVWQGRGTKTIDENASAKKREENINYAVKQIFMQYPPKKK
ncbi:MAG: DUF4136 domain-containing protein [Cyclobacteriaceae bacterium]|nr:DUF4136 domain-containing protein [Cyclobacteriaceae bacterium]